METKSELLEGPSQDYLIRVSSADRPEENIESIHSEFKDSTEELSHLARLKNMHKVVKFLINKSQKTKKQLHEFHQSMENSGECLQHPPEDYQNSPILEISGISAEKSDYLGDEIKNLEIQIADLRKKLKNSEESLEKRKNNQIEVKKLLIDLDRIQRSSSCRKPCDCRSCVTF